MKHTQVKKLSIAALLLAMNIIMSMPMFSIPVPGGHMYLNDVVICTAAILLDPLYAVIVGGVGAFLGDMLFYPPPMFVSLFAHGLQALVISLCTRRLLKGHETAGSIVGAIAGLLVSVVLYTLGRAYVYSTPAYAVAKFPFQILQTLVGSAAALLLCWKCGIVKIYRKMFRE